MIVSKHLLIRTLFVLALCSSASAQSNGRQGQDCPGLSLKVDATATTGGLNNGSAVAVVEGAVEPVYFIFFYPSGRLVNKDAKAMESKKVDSLAKGSYFCSVSDAKGCTRKIAFTID